MASELREVEEQRININVEDYSGSNASSPDARFIAFVVLILSALLFVASIYYGIINP